MTICSFFHWLYLFSDLINLLYYDMLVFSLNCSSLIDSFIFMIDSFVDWFVDCELFNSFMIYLCIDLFGIDWLIYFCEIFIDWFIIDWFIFLQWLIDFLIVDWLIPLLWCIYFCIRFMLSFSSAAANCTKLHNTAQHCCILQHTAQH